MKLLPKTAKIKSGKILADGIDITKTKHTIFITEPQLWYNVGRHFGCDNLNVGTEIELSNNFGTTLGFKCRPCLGLKWNF